MRKLAVLTFITLDGVMQSPGGPDEDSSGGFTKGGWARPCWDKVMEQVRAEAMDEPYDFLCGRTTYDMFAENFPESGEALEIKRLNEATKYVVTSRSDGLDWQNSVAIDGQNLQREIEQLKRQNGRLIQVHGSWNLIQQLLEYGLVDEFRLWTFPVIVGGGKKLFGARPEPQNLVLVKSALTVNGAVMTIYRKA